MKSAVAVPAAAPVVGRRVVSRRKPSARRRPLPPEESLAHAPALFRAIWHPEFMKYGRPDDYGELRAAGEEK